MTDRDASADVLAEIAKAASQPIHLVELYLDTQTVRVTDAWRNVSWGGNDYIAVGQLLAFDGIDESVDLQVTSVRVSLSGVMQESIALVLSHNYIDARLVIYKAFIDSTASGVVIDPIAIFDGRCDAPLIEENPDDGKCLLLLSAAQHWVDFERRPGRHTNHEEQQLHFPGDMGFQYVANLNRDLKWGPQ